MKVFLPETFHEKVKIMGVCFGEPEFIHRKEPCVQDPLCFREDLSRRVEEIRYRSLGNPPLYLITRISGFSTADNDILLHSHSELVDHEARIHRNFLEKWKLGILFGCYLEGVILTVLGVLSVLDVLGVPGVLGVLDFLSVLDVLAVIETI